MAASAEVAALTEGVFKTMFLTKIKIATGVLLAAAFVAADIGAAPLPSQRLENVPGTLLQRYEKPVRLEPVPGTQLQRYLLTVPERKAAPDPKKDAKPTLDFGVTPGPGFRVQVQDNRRDFGVTPGSGFRVPVREDRKRPDLSGTQSQDNKLTQAPKNDATPKFQTHGPQF